MAVPAQAIAQFTNGHIQGDVDLAPGVAIAPGVMLGAAPGCRLTISAGVCLGANVVVQARNGDLAIGVGANLGSGVLVVGSGTIGQHTCIAANSTVINPKVGASQVVPPDALVGDPSQSLPEDRSQSQMDLEPDPWVTNSNGQVANGQVANGRVSPVAGSSSFKQPSPMQTGPIQTGAQNGSTQNGSVQNVSQVYGKTQVSRLLETLFPQRQALNSATHGATPENRP